MPRDRTHQIFKGGSGRGRQYFCIREDMILDVEGGLHVRWAYRVAKDYENVFYTGYLKKVMCDSFIEVENPKAEKCGDVVEMWLGMLDIANMSKGHIKVLNSTADPGELLLEGACSHTLGYMNIIILSFAWSFFCVCFCRFLLVLSFVPVIFLPCFNHFSVIFLLFFLKMISLIFRNFLYFSSMKPTNLFKNGRKMTEQ